MPAGRPGTAAADSPLERPVQELRDAVGAWSVTNVILNEDGSVAQSVQGSYTFEWVIEDRALQGRSAIPDLDRRGDTRYTQIFETQSGGEGQLRPRFFGVWKGESATSVADSHSSYGSPVKRVPAKDGQLPPTWFPAALKVCAMPDPEYSLASSVIDISKFRTTQPMLFPTPSNRNIFADI